MNNNVASNGASITAPTIATNSASNPIGNITLIGCGGCGVKISAMFEPMRGKSEAGIANVQVAYIDTAFSDLPADVSRKDMYLLKGQDGSGGIRGSLAKEITAAIGEMLSLHEEGDLCIVVSSGSGGSGSVIAPSIASELTRRGKDVIAIVVGDSHNRMWMMNSMNTVRSYGGIAKLREKTIPLGYFENAPGTTELEINTQVAQLITGIAAIWSRQNQGLDSKDLKHFLSPELFSEFPPQLAMIKLYAQTIPEDVQPSVMTVASLAKSREDARLNFMTDAQYPGIAPESLSASVANLTPLHLVMLDQSFNDIVEGMEEKVRSIKHDRSQRVSRGDLLKSEPTTETGLFL